MSCRRVYLLAGRFDQQPNGVLLVRNWAERPAGTLSEANVRPLQLSIVQERGLLLDLLQRVVKNVDG